MPRVPFHFSGRQIVAVAVLLTFAGVLSACNGEPGEPTPETLPAVAGERWGGFIFFDDPDFTVPPDQVMPAPRPLEPGEGDLLFDRHPGYREFVDPSDLAAFVAGRVPVRVPEVLPPDTQLIGGYAVIGDDDSVISVGLGYQIDGSGAPLQDPDLWISHSFFHSQPLPLSVFDGNDVLAPRLRTLLGEEVIYRQVEDRPSLPGTRSSLQWFDSDGSLWTVQGRGLDLSQLVAVAESLTDVE